MSVHSVAAYMRIVSQKRESTERKNNWIMLAWAQSIVEARNIEKVPQQGGGFR